MFYMHVPKENTTTPRCKEHVAHMERAGSHPDIIKLLADSNNSTACQAGAQAVSTLLIWLGQRNDNQQEAPHPPFHLIDATIK